MAREVLNPNSTQPNDKQGDTPWDYTGKLNRMTEELYDVTNSLGNIVFVDSFDRLPTPVGNYIILDGNTRYIQTVPLPPSPYGLDLSAGGITWEGIGLVTGGFASYTYTGSAPFIIGSEVDLINFVFAQTTNAPLLDIDGAAGNFVFLTRVFLVGSGAGGGGGFGTITGISDFAMNFCGSIDIENGLKIEGSNWNTFTVLQVNLESTSPTFVGLDVTGTTLETFKVSQLQMMAPSGAVGLVGDIGSANFTSGFSATYESGGFSGGMTPTNGITNQDVGIKFQGNSGYQDTKNEGDLFLENGPETITVSASSTFYEIGTPVVGNWNSEVLSRFEFSSDGYLTYIGEEDIDVFITATASIEKTGGGSDQLEMRLAINWTAGSAGIEKSRSVTQNTTPTTVVSTALTRVSNGDTIRPIFSNNDSTSNIVVEVTDMIVKE